jgi:hypothetical protein
MRPTSRRLGSRVVEPPGLVSGINGLLERERDAGAGVFMRQIDAKRRAGHVQAADGCSGREMSGPCVRKQVSHSPDGRGRVVVRADVPLIGLAERAERTSARGGPFDAEECAAARLQRPARAGLDELPLRAYQRRLARGHRWGVQVGVHRR